jgi:hypothetical protein
VGKQTFYKPANPQSTANQQIFKIYQSANRNPQALMITTQIHTKYCRTVSLKKVLEHYRLYLSGEKVCICLCTEVLSPQKSLGLQMTNP